LIVVTGVAGRLGDRVARLLVERGYDVVGNDQHAPEGFPAKFVQGTFVTGKLLIVYLTAPRP